MIYPIRSLTLLVSAVALTCVVACGGATTTPTPTPIPTVAGTVTPAPSAAFDIVPGCNASNPGWPSWVVTNTGEDMTHRGDYRIDPDPVVPGPGIYSSPGSLLLKHGESVVISNIMVGAPAGSYRLSVSYDAVAASSVATCPTYVPPAPTPIPPTLAPVVPNPTPGVIRPGPGIG